MYYLVFDMAPKEEKRSASGNLPSERCGSPPPWVQLVVEVWKPVQEWVVVREGERPSSNLVWTVHIYCITGAPTDSIREYVCVCEV